MRQVTLKTLDAGDLSFKETTTMFWGCVVTGFEDFIFGSHSSLAGGVAPNHAGRGDDIFPSWAGAEAPTAINVWAAMGAHQPELTGPDVPWGRWTVDGYLSRPVLPNEGRPSATAGSLHAIDHGNGGAMVYARNTSADLWWKHNAHVAPSPRRADRAEGMRPLHMDGRAISSTAVVDFLVKGITFCCH